MTADADKPKHNTALATPINYSLGEQAAVVFTVAILASMIAWDWIKAQFAKLLA